jgi:CO/xanthine dehydrogenase Mo-binding subunit
MSAHRYVGQDFPALEDRRFVRGRGRYINDLVLPGMLHLATVPSPLPHARLVGLDAGAAERAPGVAAVLTGPVLAEVLEPVPQDLDLPNVRWYPLAVDRVRFAGEWVAAVVAETRAEAEDAAELVRVELEELPTVLDPEAATGPGAPVIHPEHGSNVAWQDAYTWGDVDRAFAEAAHRVRYRFRWHRHAGVPLETFGAVASLDQGTGILEVWASHQTPGLHQHIATALRWPSHRVRLHQDLDVGGSYGAKRGHKQVFLTAAAAVRCGRPVKFIEDRVENLRGGDAHGPDRIFEVALAVDRAGGVQALDVEVVDDVGAYVGRGPLQMAKPITAVVGPYRIPCVRYRGRAVITNKVNQSPFRGFGMAPHNFALERALDLAAAELGIDRLEMRRRNYIPRDAFPYRIPSGAIYDSGDYALVLERACELADLPRLREAQREARADGRLLGIGVAGCLEPSGGNQDVFGYVSARAVGMTPEGARIQVDQGGRVVVAIGFQSTGQGHETMVTQLAAEELGVEPGDVTVIRADSLGGVPSTATIASRMTYMLGSALVQAAGKVRRKLCRLAAHQWGVAPERVEYRSGGCVDRERPERRLSLAELARVAHRRQDLLPADMEPGLVETAVAKVPDGAHPLDPDRRIRRGYPSYAFSVHIPVVEIDREALAPRILGYHVVHDCGTVLNHRIVNGMVLGGIAHGVGAAFYERFVYDAQGQLQTGSFMDYLLPTAAEVPRVTLAEHVTPSPLHPYGAKGSGEGGYMTAPAALASAVDDALAPLGVRIHETPITPDLLYRLLHRPPHPDSPPPGGRE